MPETCSTTKSILQLSADKLTSRSDCIAIEEELHIQIDNTFSYTSARTPGQEKEQAVGYCFSSGCVEKYSDIRSLHVEKDTPDTVKVELKNKRNHKSLQISGDDSFCLSFAEIFDFQQKLESKQKLFKQTGSTHAAAIFSKSGELLGFGEDIGRCNAIDKAVGTSVMAETSDNIYVMVISSRVNKEIVEKAIRSGVKILAAVSGASSMAIEIADKCGLTLIGFARGDKCNLYCHPHRLKEAVNY